jgi:Zn finger protein HypA/HybF involved in hydrogenase expression
MLRCQGCCCEFPMNEGFVCPQCHSQQVSLISGDEFYLDTINVEELTDEPNSCN